MFENFGSNNVQGFGAFWSIFFQKKFGKFSHWKTCCPIFFKVENCALKKDDTIFNARFSGLNIYGTTRFQRWKRVVLIIFYLIHSFICFNHWVMDLAAHVISRLITTDWSFQPAQVFAHALNRWMAEWTRYDIRAWNGAHHAGERSLSCGWNAWASLCIGECPQVCTEVNGNAIHHFRGNLTFASFLT